MPWLSLPLSGATPLTRFQYFKKVAQLPSVALSGGQLNFAGLAKSDTWVALITFLYLDFMDGTSVMVGVNVLNACLDCFSYRGGTIPILP